eukprot:SAG31_NODE_5483_length_2513_cov_2.273405_2_plen_132_part_00
MQQSLERLVDQLRSIVPTNALLETNRTSGTTISTDTQPVWQGGSEQAVTELRAELDSLREELAKAATQQRSGSSAKEPSSLAPVPAEVPPLSLNLRLTKGIETLKTMLISSEDSTMTVTSEKSKVGALGMG